MAHNTDNLGDEAQNRSQSDSQSSPKLTTSQILAAIIAILIGIAACSWGTYAVQQQQAKTPKGLMNQCKNSIRRIEQNLSKHAA